MDKIYLFRKWRLVEDLGIYFDSESFKFDFWGRKCELGLEFY